jgi:hypothetical protein
MAASDAIMYRTAKEGRLGLLADRAAREEGLRGHALDRRVQEMLGRTDEQNQLHLQTAAGEGYTGAALQARVNELREQSLPMHMNADASDFAGVATYNHEPRGFLGAVGKSVARLSQKFPLLRAVVPFTRIVANVTNRGLNYTPWGFKRALRGYSGEEGTPKGDEHAQLMARATMGTVGLSALLALQQKGVIQINGGGPQDTEKRKQLRETGWRPYSLKIGDKYVSYVYTPIGLGLSILGNMSDAVRYGEMDQPDAMTRAGYAIARVGSTIFSQSFLSGLSNLFGALSDPGRSVSSIRSMISQTGGTLSTPRILLDIERLFDRRQFTSTSIAGDLVNNTPFAALVNKPALNAFGEPVRPPSNRFLSSVTDDPAWHFVADSGLRVPVPDKYTQVPDGRGGQRQLTPEEYYEYLEKTGPQMKRYLMLERNVLDRLIKSGQNDTAQNLLQNIAMRVRAPVIAGIRERARRKPID